MQPPPTPPPSELRQALAACRTSFLATGFFSLFINLLLLVPALYMLEVYDRVLSSNSEATLLMLTLIVVFLFMVMGGLEWIRTQILIAVSARIDGQLGGRIFDAVFIRSLATAGKIANTLPIADLGQLRQFLTGPNLFAFFDAPWLPIYVAVMFVFHPWYGVVTLLSIIVLGALTLWNEAATKSDLERANHLASEASAETQHNLRNAEAIVSMGMLPRLRDRWQEKQAAALALQMEASRRGGLIGTLSRTFRLTVQSLILGLGAYLAIQRELTPGMLVAGSILLGRALAPLDQMIGSWRGFLAARGAYRRLDALLAAAPARAPLMALPPPRGAVQVERLAVTPPGAPAPVLKGIGLDLEAGEQLAIIGPSGAGKSTLARAMLGICRASAGSVRLDGAELEQWDAERLGVFLGYLPQDVELLDGTVGENIARFGPVDPVLVVEAARAAGVHELILRLPEGYETRLAGNGNTLSAGQKQRIGIARALYGDPRLIVLDEPNSNLDQEGDAALQQTLRGLKARGRTVVVVTHRGHLLEQVDKIALLMAGQLVRFGPAKPILASLQSPVASIARPPAAGSRGAMPAA